MVPPKYLLHVHSHPIRTTISTWQQWYTEEHLRDMVYHRASTTAALYRATTNVLRYPPVQPLSVNDEATLSLARVPSAIPPDESDFMDFLALYQCERKGVLESEDYVKQVRVQSGLWDQISSCHDVGSFGASEWEVVEVGGDGKEAADSAAPHLLHCKVMGSGAEESANSEAQLDALRQIDGYRRSISYCPVTADTHEVNGNDMAESENKDYALILHEFDSAVNDKVMENVKTAMAEAIGGSKDLSFALRAFELISSEGFDGKVRTPERLPRR